MTVLTRRGQQLEPTAVFMAGHPLIRRADIIIANELDDGMARSGCQSHRFFQTACR